MKDTLIADKNNYTELELFSIWIQGGRILRSTYFSKVQTSTKSVVYEEGI